MALNIIKFRRPIMEINKLHVASHENRKVAVPIDMATFEKIDSEPRNYRLSRLMQEQDDRDVLEMQTARDNYQSLDKQ